MKRRMWGFLIPVFMTAACLGGIRFLDVSPQWTRSFALGMSLALTQSLLSMGVLAWAWKKPFFYWCWGGGMLFRLLVFSGTAYFVWQHPSFGFLTVLLSLVVATTLFLVIESATIFGKS